MTQLYRLDASAQEIAKRFGAVQGEDPWAGGYVAQMKFAPIITAGREFVAGPQPADRRLQPRLIPRLWGVAPPPSSSDPTRRITHIRNLQSPFWIGNLRNSEFRCLVPATQVMLWGNETDYEGRRLKHWFAPEDEVPFAMAGVWKDEEVPSFALLTLDPIGEPKARGCKSMPLALPDTQEARQTWLHGDWDAAQRLVNTHKSAPLLEIPPIA